MFLSLSLTNRRATAICILLIQWCRVLAADTEAWKWNDPKDLGIPGLHHVTLESASMNRTVGFNIYLPPHYVSESDRRFPVVFFLHGAGGTESSDAGLAHHVHAEIVAGRIPPVIYVFPNGGERSGYRDSTNSYVRAETLLIRELLPRVDRDYRTLTNADGRGICGFSMGGGGAMRLSLKYPDLFGSAASLAAALDPVPESRDSDNVYNHVTALAPEQREKLRLLLVVGEEDFLFSRHGPFLKHLKETGIASTFTVHSKVGHDLGKLTHLSAGDMIRHLAREMQTQLLTAGKR